MKIGELAKAVDCTVETIRFYEQQNLLPPVERGKNNFRCYNMAHLERLTFIRYCRSLDISLEEIKLLLRLEKTPQSKEVVNILDKHISDIAKRIHELDHLRMQLIKLKGEYHQNIQQESLMKSLLKHRGIGVKITPI